MLNKGFLLAVLAALVTASSEPTKTSWEDLEAFALCPGPYPEEECSSEGITAGDFVADPYDCHSYYVCIIVNGDQLAPSDQPVMCPPHQHFSTITNSCEIGTSCNLTCSRSCQTECTDGAVIGYVGDCTKYFYCPPGSPPIEIDCPPDAPYFDGAGCVSDPRACCIFCSPYCGYVGIEVPDPYNCSMYYLCLSIGYPSEDAHFPCPTGQIFNFTSGSCTDGTSCENTCSTTTTDPTGVTSTSVNTKTSTASPGMDCLETYSCPGNGFYPRCPYCDQSYFTCMDGLATIDYCEPGLVFSSDTYCTIPTDCSWSK